jgi:circadian clock protein KaiC
MDRITTGIEALDGILRGGIPAGSCIMIAGKPGTGKTILANQIVFNNDERDNRTLYLTTMSEPQAKILKFQNEFTYFDISRFQSGVFYYDLSTIIRREGPSKLLALVDELMLRYQPKIVVIDTIKVLGDIIESVLDMREFLMDLSMKLAVWDCTTLLIGEYPESEIDTRPESAIVDGIIYLSGTEEKKFQKRFLRILKMRGTDYAQGEIYFKITKEGLRLFPRLNPDVGEQSYQRDFSQRISTGIPALDRMMGGGLPESTVTMVSGGAGTGKTILAAHFAYEGLSGGETVVYCTFEEHPKQFISSALSVGLDFRPFIRSGQLMIIHTSPVELDMDEHIFMIQEFVREYRAKRLVIDSISSFELGVVDKIKYTDYIFSLTNYLKTMGVSTLITHEMHHSVKVDELTKYGISFVADNLILLQNKESELQVRKFLRVIKVRSSAHEMDLREFRITCGGVEIIGFEVPGNQRVRQP